MELQATAPQADTLSRLSRDIAAALTRRELSDRWVVAELSDVAVRGGHCYMELIEKDEATGRQLAKMRAIVWANRFWPLSAAFRQATGREFATGLRVMVRVSVNFHQLFGMSLIVSDINPSYTMGDLERRRQAILAQLRADGVLELNRSLPIAVAPTRVAVISAQGAAGYGDFMKQLHLNPRRLKFTTRLFPAIMQGERSAQSIIAALEAVADEAGQWDCVAILRGGGSTSDLAAYEDLQLAQNVAQFPLPVVIGIGHERDITVLDYIAAVRCKTPTAVAEWLVNRVANVLDAIGSRAQAIHRGATERLNGELRRLAYTEGNLPAMARGALSRASTRLSDSLLALTGISSRRIAPQLSRLDGIAARVPLLATATITRSRERLEAREQLLEVLSPMATLRRGYTITRIDGHAISRAADVARGAVIETVTAEGTLRSTILSTDNTTNRNI